MNNVTKSNQLQTRAVRHFGIGHGGIPNSNKHYQNQLREI